MSTSVRTLKPRQLQSPPQNLVKFDSNTEIKSISIPTLKTREFCMSLDTKTTLILIQTLNEVIFDPHKITSILIPTLKSSQVRLPTLKSSLCRPPTQQPRQFDANTRTMSFWGRVIFRVTVTCSCHTAAIRIISLRIPTRIVLDVSILRGNSENSA